MYTGEIIGAERALSMGLVDEVHPAEMLDARVEAWIAMVLERSELTQTATKQMVDETVREGRVKPATTLHFESEMDRSGEVREGVAAFLGKRPPRWPFRRPR
jgi:enoyl-CoA hydratase/carnithine racemase